MPIFKIDVESKLSKDAKIIVACSTAGTMKPSMNLPEGIQSRYWRMFMLFGFEFFWWFITVRSTGSTFLAEPYKLVGYARIEHFYFFNAFFFSLFFMSALFLVD